MTQQKIDAPLATGFMVQGVSETVTALIFRLHDQAVRAVSVENAHYTTLVSLILREAQNHAAKHKPEEKKTGELTAAPLLVSAVGIAPHSDTQALLVMHLGNLSLPFLVDLSTLLGMCSNLQKVTKEAPTKPKN